MAHDPPKLKAFPFAKLLAALFGLLGLLAGILYSVGGLIYDLVTTGSLNPGTALAFLALIGMALLFALVGLAAGLVGDNFSYEAAEVDNGDGGPAIGGEFVLALSPDLLAGPGWAEHSDAFLSELEAMDGVRLPGQRRFAARRSTEPIDVDAELVESLRTLR